ncbi:AraC family transcriptional regulator [Thalassolituus sp. LLYu03]|uniref:AraC family transcriptional regulator n=1 Tax=Thalassolituus sp. LLYu03 TaxID=3421656 RepID=UPI003D2E1F3F
MTNPPEQNATNASRPLPRPELATTSGAWVRLLLRGAAHLNLPSNGLLAAAGFDDGQQAESALADPQLRLPQAQITALWQSMQQAYGGDDLALQIGRGFDPAQAPVISYALRSSTNVRQAVERLLRFHQLIGEALVLRVSEQDGGLMIRVQPGQPVPDLSVQTALVAIAGVLHWLLPERPLALTVTMRRPAPAQTEPWTQWFGQPVGFAARADTLSLSAALLATPLQAQVRGSEHDRAAAQAMAALREQKAMAHIRYWLEQALQLGEPDREWVARCLGVSVSTLQRRLRVHGESFRSLLEDTRQQLALRLLAQGVGLNEIALRLGYQEQSNFQRAFRRWFGMTPGQWRRQSF